jgi:hypothetical protein
MAKRKTCVGVLGVERGRAKKQTNTASAFGDGTASQATRAAPAPWLLQQLVARRESGECQLALERFPRLLELAACLADPARRNTELSGGGLARCQGLCDATFWLGSHCRQSPKSIRAAATSAGPAVLSSTTISLHSRSQTSKRIQALDRDAPGHSEDVAKEHYWQITEDDFRRAACETTGETGQNVAEKAGQGVAHRTNENTPKTSTGPSEEIRNSLKQNELRNFQMTPTGLEPVLPP